MLTGKGRAWRGLRALGAARGGGGLLREEPVTLASSHCPSLEQLLSQASGHSAAFEGHLHPGGRRKANHASALKFHHYKTVRVMRRTAPAPD